MRNKMCEIFLILSGKTEVGGGFMGFFSLQLQIYSRHNEPLVLSNSAICRQQREGLVHLF